MRTILEVFSNVLGGVSIMLLAFGLTFGSPKIALAQSQSGFNCTNGGGGNTKCVANADNDGCTVATNGAQCDANASCTCGSSTTAPCECN